jgi:hypothetical protein
MPAAKPTQGLIKRALEAWLECGLPVGGVHVAPDGSVKVLAPSECEGVASRAEGGNTCDDIFGAGSG